MKLEIGRFVKLDTEIEKLIRGINEIRVSGMEFERSDIENDERIYRRLVRGRTV